MAAIRERFQNPTCGDTVKLRLFTYNQNNLTNVNNVVKVEIYHLDPAARMESNPHGRRLVETLTDVTQEDVGKYLAEIALESPKYVIGRYVDVWYLEFEGEECGATVENVFDIYPDLWYTTPIPVVYDFGFSFRPNRLRKGSKRYIIIEVTPNVPKGSDLGRYYENLAIASDVRVTIEMKCGDCVPQEEDLRIIVDRASTEYREKRFAYYFLDTTDMDCGVYDIWFELAMGENVYVSEKNQILIF